jgi:hypothetical protein
MIPRLLPLLCASLLLGSLLLSKAADPAPAVSFEKDVQPLLAAKCLQCHGDKKQSASLDLRSKAAMLRGGDSGPALVPGDAGKSLLFDMVHQGKMPPKKENRLTAEQVALLKGWIAAGAPAAAAGDATAEAPVAEEDQKFWAFQKAQRPEVPKVRGADRVRTRVDAFLLARLETRGLTFAADAERTVFLRRASLDLIGLPPTPEEIEAFLSDQRPDAHGRLIDRLLASPHFGERWGRHWLDAAGYTDVLSLDNDAGIINLTEGKWRYRDYVVRSFNGDKPFDRFLTEQIAGDELADWRSAPTLTPEMQELLIATGFLRTAPDDTYAPELNKPREHHQILQKTGEVVVNNLLALTLQCAKCHDHKYEPIAQRDYYRFLAIFSPAFSVEKWLTPKDRALPDAGPADRARIEKHNADIVRQVAEQRAAQAEVRQPHEDRLREVKLATLPEAIRADTNTALQTPADKRNEVQKYLAGKFEAQLRVKPEEVNAALNPTEQKAIEVADQRIAECNNRRLSWGSIQAVWDVAPPPRTVLLKRGEYEMPGIEVQPGLPAVLRELKDAPQDKPAGQTSGRRLALARALTDPQSRAGALVARVQVNRIWMHLFGRGLVETADNFGRSGAKPTHPELLEWLTARYLQEDRRLKPLLRLLMTSTAYRQSATRPVGPEAGADPGNELLWKMRLRRLESEIVRDSLLAASGRLDATLGGEPVPLEVLPDGMVIIKRQGLPTPTSAFRRSLYLLGRRNYHPTLLDVFDQPLLPASCVTRKPAAVVTQSLTMLNDTFVRERADDFARHVAAAPAAKRIELAFRIALGRPPKPQEAGWSGELLQKHAERYHTAGMPSDQAEQKALTHLCHMLLNTSEFLYVP